MSERFSVGLKFRYGDSFDDFENGDNAWKPLRGHESTVGPPGHSREQSARSLCHSSR